MFRSPRALLVLFIVSCLARLAVFARGPADDGRAVDGRGFLSVCEASAYAASAAPGPADTARLCSCILSWHLKESERYGYPLPAGLYRDGAAAEVSSLAVQVDGRARAACGGRPPR